MRLRRKFRRKILPIDEILDCFKGYQFQTCLDIGAGTGIFLETLYIEGIIKRGVGVEIEKKYFRKINDDLCIVDEKELRNEKYNLIIFNDVFHHVKKYLELANNYLNKLQPGGYIFIKEMSDEKLIYKYFNRLHDLILARKPIKEVPIHDLKEYFYSGFDVIKEGRKRRFFYDHYFLMFKQKIQV